MTFEEFNRTKEERKQLREKRRELFVSLDFRPLQILLGMGVLAYVLSDVSLDLCYWPHMRFPGLRLIFAAIFFLFWLFHFDYYRINFLLLGSMAGGSLLSLFGHFYIDCFHIVEMLALIIILATTSFFYAKMKDPIFSTKYKSESAD